MDLPDEVLLEVLSWVPPHDLACSLPLVCRRWQQLARDPAPWQRLHRRWLGVKPDAVGREATLAEEPEEEKEHEVDETEDKSWTVVELQRPLLWMPRQDRAHEIEREQQLWRLEKTKWERRLMWAAAEGYVEPVQQSLVELERLTMQTPRQLPPAEVGSLSGMVLPRYSSYASSSMPRELAPELPAFSIDLLGQMGRAAMVACGKGRVNVVQLLLDRGAELGEQLFSFGIQCDSLEMAQLVLDRAPESLVRDRELALDLVHTLVVDDVKIAKLDLLLERHYIDQSAYDHCLARGLVRAVNGNDIDAARVLLPAGASANTTTPHRAKPLLFKAVAKGIGMVKLLLDYGATPSAEFAYGQAGQRTPLDRAVRRGAMAIVELLLQRGAEPKLSEEMPRFVGQAFNDCVTLVQRARRQHFMDSLTS